MEYLRGYRVFRRDPAWFDKLVVGSILMLSSLVVPALGQVIVIGWQAQVMRRAVRGEVTPLPPLTWERPLLTELVLLGFKALVVQLVWTVPVFVVATAVSLALPFALVPTIAESEDPEKTMALVMAAISVVVFVFVLLALIPAQVAAMRAELTGRLERGLEVRAVLGFSRAMFRELFVGTLVTAGVGVLFLAAASLCCVPAFPASVVIVVVQGHFLAQVYERWVERGGEPLDLAER